MDEFNATGIEVLNALYEISHPQKHTHIRKRVSYKNGKHAYKKDKYTYAIKNMHNGKFKTCTNTRTGVTIILRRVK